MPTKKIRSIKYNKRDFATEILFQIPRQIRFSKDQKNMLKGLTAGESVFRRTELLQPFFMVCLLAKGIATITS